MGFLEISMGLHLLAAGLSLVLAVVAVTDPTHLNMAASGAVLMGQAMNLPVIGEGTVANANFQAVAQKPAVAAAHATGMHVLGAGNDVGAAKDQAITWTYKNTNWEEWPMCRKGVHQSPVDMVRPFWGAFLKLQQRYQDQLWPTQVNDGRMISVEFKQGDGSVLQIGDKEVFPTKLSFHSPSMHKLNGTYYDMEMQVMHKDSADNMVGLAVLMQVSDLPPENFYIKDVFSHFFTDLPKPGNKKRTESLNLKWVLNDKMVKHYVTYQGSLTHPPCTEGVQWFVLGSPWNIDAKWKKAFSTVVPTPNVRPIQDIGDRSFESF